MASQNGTVTNDERDEESGRFSTKYPPEAFLNAIRATANEATDLARANDVAEEVGCDAATAHRKLNALAEEGRVEKVELPPAVGWRIIDEEETSNTETKQ